MGFVGNGARVAADSALRATSVSVAESARAAGRREIHFPPFRLDLDAGYLRSGDQAVSLRPKTWDVLCYLAERPGVLVTKEELLDAVWTGISVTESTLTKSIGEICCSFSVTWC